jgi:hypothetical protein
MTGRVRGGTVSMTAAAGGRWEKPGGEAAARASSNIASSRSEVGQAERT